jgi:hypothetical protein
MTTPSNGAILLAGLFARGICRKLAYYTGLFIHTHDRPPDGPAA